MKKVKILKWLIIGTLLTTSVISVVVISIYAVSLFNYLYIALATVASVLSTWRVFKLKEDGTQLDESKLNDDKGGQFNEQ